jgi:broad specificity phosphatase PhoE
MPGTSLEQFRTKYGQAAYNELMKALGPKDKPYTNTGLSQLAKRVMNRPANDIVRNGKQVARIRGSSDVPMTDAGAAEVQDRAAQIAAKGGMDLVMSSPLQRARNTAVAIAKHNGAPVQIDHNLMPWKMGVFEGQPVENVKHMIAKIANDHPDEKMPGMSPTSTTPGESFNDFKGRFIGKFLAPLMAAHAQEPSGKIGLVSHLRDILAAKSWIENGARQDLQFDHHDINYETKSDKTDTPSSVHRIYPEGDKWKFEDVKMDGPEPFSPGIYMIRHGKTDWNAESKTGVS